MNSWEQRFLFWASALIVSIIALFSGSTVLLNLSMRQMFVELQQQAEQFQSFEQQGDNLIRAEQLYGNQQYENCLHIVERIPSTSPYGAWSRSLLEKCQAELVPVWLEEAKEWAAQRQFRKAVKVASRIKSGKHYEVVQRQIRDWTREILDYAQDQYHNASSEADRANAMAIVMDIPSENPLYEEAIALRNEWQRNWTEHEQDWRTAQQALAAGNIALVKTLAQESLKPARLVPTFWRQRWTDLLAEAENTWTKYDSYRQAAEHHLAQGNSAEAILLVEKLPEYAPWGEVKAKMMAEAAAQHRIAANQQRAMGETMRLVAAVLGGGSLGFIRKPARR